MPPAPAAANNARPQPARRVRRFYHHCRSAAMGFAGIPRGYRVKLSILGLCAQCRLEQRGSNRATESTASTINDCQCDCPVVTCNRPNDNSKATVATTKPQAKTGPQCPRPGQFAMKYNLILLLSIVALSAWCEVSNLDQGRPSIGARSSAEPDIQLQFVAGASGPAQWTLWTRAEW